MNLILTVLRCPPAVTPETRTVTGGEFTVGRGPGVDWVLADPDQGVSRRHFTLEFRGGDWQIADESANGTYTNRDDAPIGKGRRRTLRDHDRLRAGPYEIEVNLQEAAAPRQSDPYSYSDKAPGDFSGAIPEIDFDDPFAESLGSIDAPPAFNAGFAQQTQADHSSVLQDAMRLSEPMGYVPAQTGGVIPADDLLSDDWDKDLLEGISGATPKTALLNNDPFSSDPFSTEPFSVVSIPATPLQATPIPATPIRASRLRAEPFVDHSVSATLGPAGPIPAASLPEPAFTAPPALVMARPVPSPPIPVASADDTALIAAFLTGAGLPDAKPADPAATLRRLGEAFRALVTGLRSVLIARASIKSEFRIEQTLIRARGNNPLKFSADDDDAISALLGVGRRTDMTAAAAITDALRDIRLHELASIAAMQTAVRAVLDGLHPDKIRATAEQGGGMAVLPGQRKARAWDVYDALHTRTVQALSDDFDSVFGKAFARAYEEALDDLSTKERT